MAVTRNDVKLFFAGQGLGQQAPSLPWIKLIVLAPEHQRRYRNLGNALDRIDEESLRRPREWKRVVSSQRPRIVLQFLVELRVGSQMKSARHFGQGKSKICFGDEFLGPAQC